MKKILFLLLSIVSISASAQSTAQIMPGSNGLVLDTVTNAGTETWTLKVPGYKKVVAAQVVITKISGTLGGTVTLQGSLNGVNFVAIPSQTYTATDVASQSAIFTLDNSKYVYYRISWTGTGTMSASARSYLSAFN